VPNQAAAAAATLPVHALITVSDNEYLYIDVTLMQQPAREQTSMKARRLQKLLAPATVNSRPHVISSCYHFHGFQ
jgi:hypothetical protein